MPSTASPRDASRRLVLRAEVARLRARETRRAFDPSLHVGLLDGDRTGFVLRAKDRPAVDVSVLRDVADRLVADSGSSGHTAWVVRPGQPEPHDLDLQWLAAVLSAFGSHDRPLSGCFVITPSGWRDLLTDETRTWVRLRP
ncbi:MAG TPA: hypothetical protein VER39_10845 [Nocardioidaceae bacterium]|nr:hypothetical protein [Nocardioidaceae bacterium]